METDRAERQRKRKELRRMRRVIDDIVTNDSFISAVVEAHNNEPSGAEFKANHKAYFKGKGCEIPNEIDLQFIDLSRRVLCLEINGSGLRAGTELESSDEQPSTNPRLVAEFKKMVREASDMITSDAMLDVVEEAEADPELRKQFCADPKAYLRGKGINRRDTGKFGVREQSPQLFYYQKVCNLCGCTTTFVVLGFGF